MAPFSNFITFLFLTTLLLSLQSNARDSQFFSKVTHANNNGKETELPNKEELVNKPEQEPAFILETDNSYGLYGHESGQFSPTTTTGGAATTITHQPYKTESEEYMSKYPNKYSYYNKDAYNTYQNDFGINNNNYFNKDAYGRNQNELDNTRYTEGVHDSVSNQKRKNQKYYSSKNGANDRYTYYGERQGMSDTRFMEGGKYYYNVESEKYNPTFHGESRVKSKNWENNRGYFGGPNHPNSYENNNSMEGYQNQKIEGNKDDFEP